jgi:hypothetical protein
MVRSRTSLSVRGTHREMPGTLMTCLQIVAPSTPIAGWFLSSSRGNYTTRPSDVYHVGQLWSLNHITSNLWALFAGECDVLCSDEPPETMRATQFPRLHPQAVCTDAQTAWLSEIEYVRRQSTLRPNSYPVLHVLAASSSWKQVAKPGYPQAL